MIFKSFAAVIKKYIQLEAAAAARVEYMSDITNEVKSVSNIY